MAKTVLAIDDSASIRQMVAFTLKSSGYEVIEAVDGQDGLDKAKTKSVNLVLTDQNMPRMDGLTLIRNLRGMGAVQGDAHSHAHDRVVRRDEGARTGCGCDRLAGQALRSAEAGRGREEGDRLTFGF